MAWQRRQAAKKAVVKVSWVIPWGGGGNRSAWKDVSVSSGASCVRQSFVSGRGWILGRVGTLFGCGSELVLKCFWVGSESVHVRSGFDCGSGPIRSRGRSIFIFKYFFILNF